MTRTDDRNLRLGKLLTLVLLVQVSHASAASLFEESGVLEAHLAGPLGTLIEENDDRLVLPFVLRVNGLEHSIKVKVRGKSRRRVCSFPPLRFEFARDDTAQSVFEGQRKLKLVTHCRGRRSAGSYALKEYAAYRIFNLLSDVSYRVRLLHINYTDTDGRLDGQELDHYGFLIESTSGLAARVGGQPEKVAGVSRRSFDNRQAGIAFIFQYLIGNTDWSLVAADDDDTCCHNGDLFDIGSVRHYVPYDFDQSGLVNTGYARPDPSLRISRVTQRKYRGYCISADVLRDALGAVKARRVDILNVIRGMPELSQKQIEASLRYLEKFFRKADDTDKMLRSFERACL